MHCSRGLQVTVEVCLISFACAIVGGLVLCLVRMYVRPAAARRHAC